MQIKICGLTTKKEALYLNKHKVDFAGFVLFFPKSKRNNTIEQAQSIMAELLPAIKKVAVVVSPSLDEIHQIEDAGFDYIQIHATLSNEIIQHVKLPIIKAFNVSDMDQYESFHKCDKIIGYVFDAQEPGSGKAFDWSLVKDIPRDEKILLLAGGLSSENVAKAIEYIKPDGVDVSSGVEYDNNLGKDPEKISAFVDAVRHINTK